MGTSLTLSIKWKSSYRCFSNRRHVLFYSAFFLYFASVYIIYTFCSLHRRGFRKTIYIIGCLQCLANLAFFFAPMMVTKGSFQLIGQNCTYNNLLFAVSVIDFLWFMKMIISTALFKNKTVSQFILSRKAY